MCTLLDLACMDSSYETMQDIGIGKKIKSFQNDLKRICGPLEVCSWACKPQMITLLGLVCMNTSYEIMQDRVKGKKKKFLEWSQKNLWTSKIVLISM